LNGHWRETYPANLKRAYFITVGMTALVLIVFLAANVIKSLNIFESSNSSTAETRVIAFTYAQLGPPPSLTAEEGTLSGAGGGIPVAPNAGVPKPVADTAAVAETTPTQAELGGVSPLAGTGTGGFTMGDEIPASRVYLPYLRVEVKPEPVFIPMPEFPKNFRRAGWEDANVIVNGLVDVDGKIKTVEIVQSSGNAVLDTIAGQAALESIFTPARHQDRPVRVWVSIPFHFAPPGHGQ
jgi:TonB family protein